MAEKKQQDDETVKSGLEDRKSVKRLTRSTSDRVLAGVCGGLAEYLEIDVVLVRCIWGGLILFGGLGLLPYLLAWIIVPENSKPRAAETDSPEKKSHTGLIWGGLLICIGAWIIFRQLEWFGYYPMHFRWDFGPRWFLNSGFDFFLPALVILLGVYYLVNSFRKDKEDVNLSGDSNMGKKLTRSVSDKMLAGVCGGIAKYFNIDASLVRIAFALLTLAGGGFIGIIAYVVMMVVVPEETIVEEPVAAKPEAPQVTKPAAKTKTQAKPKAPAKTKTPSKPKASPKPTQDKE